MHIQQTKDSSLASGGAQYFFHSLPAHVKEFLRKRGACPVLLQTPYGITSSSFMAVGKDHKLSSTNKIIPGKVGHDRIQGAESIGEAIRYWYGLKSGCDFERIDVDAVIHDDGHFILIPTAIKMRTTKRSIPLEKVTFPLSFHQDHQSKLWKQQIARCRKHAAEDVSWAGRQIKRVVDDHVNGEVKRVHEADLLRAAGALSLIGLDLGLYLVKGYDCPQSRFSFGSLPQYPCPVEIKKKSSGFNYQIMKYAELPRAVVLCITHDLVNPPDHVDVIELAALAEYLKTK